jgi:hypothetical protein
MKKLFFVAVFSVLLFACQKEPSTYYKLGDNIKILDDERKLEFYDKVNQSINSSENYFNTADFINNNLTAILQNNEKPLFYDEITIKNIYNKTVPYPSRSMIHNYWNKGDLIFDKNSVLISVRGGIILYKENDKFYYTTNTRSSVNSIDIENAIIHQLLVYNE